MELADLRAVQRPTENLEGTIRRLIEDEQKKLATIDSQIARKDNLSRFLSQGQLAAITQLAEELIHSYITNRMMDARRGSSHFRDYWFSQEQLAKIDRLTEEIRPIRDRYVQNAISYSPLFRKPYDIGSPLIANGIMDESTLFDLIKDASVRYENIQAEAANLSCRDLGQEKLLAQNGIKEIETLYANLNALRPAFEVRIVAPILVKNIYSKASVVLKNYGNGPASALSLMFARQSQFEGKKRFSFDELLPEGSASVEFPIKPLDAGQMEWFWRIEYKDILLRSQATENSFWIDVAETAPQVAIVSGDYMPGGTKVVDSVVSRSSIGPSKI